MRVDPKESSILEAALIGLQVKRQDIDARLVELRSLLNRRGPGRSPRSSVEVEPPKPVTRKISAAGRRAISEAQKARWRVQKAAAAPVAPKKKLSRAAYLQRVEALKKGRAARARKARGAA